MKHNQVPPLSLSFCAVAVALALIATTGPPGSGTQLPAAAAAPSTALAADDASAGAQEPRGVAESDGAQESAGAEPATSDSAASEDQTAAIPSGATDTLAVPVAVDSVGTGFWVLGDSVQVPRNYAGPRLRQFISDSLAINQRAVMALHAEPHGRRSTAAQVADRLTDCDSLRTAVSPGEWDIFIVALDIDQIAGAMFSFEFPEDWIVHGFRVNPALGNPFTAGGLRRDDQRPRLLVFNCIAHPEHTNLLLPDMTYEEAAVVVLGSLDLTATSPGSIALVEHADPRYGAPEIATCLSTTDKITTERLGRVDAGRGPGKRPCRTAPAVGNE